WKILVSSFRSAMFPGKLGILLVLARQGTVDEKLPPFAVGYVSVLVVTFPVSHGQDRTVEVLDAVKNVVAAVLRRMGPWRVAEISSLRARKELQMKHVFPRLIPDVRDHLPLDDRIADMDLGLLSDLAITCNKQRVLNFQCVGTTVKSIGAFEHHPIVH